MRKKCQVAQEAIFYIFLLIVIAGILIMGFKAFKGLKSKEDIIDATKLKTSIRNDISVISKDFGTLAVKEYEVPDGISEICFIGSGFSAAEPASEGLKDSSLEIFESLETGVKDNLFIIGDKKEIKDSDYVGEIEINSPGWLCYTIKENRFKLQIEGLAGSKARIE